MLSLVHCLCVVTYTAECSFTQRNPLEGVRDWGIWVYLYNYPIPRGTDSPGIEGRVLSEVKLGASQSIQVHFHHSQVIPVDEQMRCQAL